MVDEDFEIVGLGESVLRRIAEEIGGMADDELVKRGRRRDQHRARAAATAPGAASTLPGCSNRARVACHHSGVERADVDTKFQSTGRDHAANAAVPQATLDFPPFARAIAPPPPPPAFR